MPHRWSRRLAFLVGALLLGVGTLLLVLFLIGWWLEDDRSVSLAGGLALIAITVILPGWLLARWGRRDRVAKASLGAADREREGIWLAAIGLVIVGAILFSLWSGTRASKDGLVHLTGTVVDTHIQIAEGLRDYESTIEVVVDNETIWFVSNHGISTTAIGDSVDVWYDPDRPGEDTFVTDEDLRRRAVGPVLLGIVLVLIVVPVLLFQWWRGTPSPFT